VTADIAGPFGRNRFRRNEYDRAIWRRGGPSLTPLLAAQFGWSTAFLVAAGLGVVGSLAWLFVNAERTLLGKSAERI